MALKFLKHKWQKVVFATFSTIIVIILIAGFFINRYWSPILADKVRNVVLKSSDSLYKVDFSSAELHVLQGKIVIFNITLKPDTAIYNLRKKQGLAPNNLVELQVKRLVIKQMHPFKLYFKHILDIGQISLSAPEVHISYQLNHTKDTTTKDHRTAWQKASKSLHSIHVGDIFLNDVKFRYDDYSGHKLAISELKEMNLHANDLLIDSATQTDRSRLLYCKDIVTELNNYTGKAPNGLYTYTVRHLKLSSLKSQLNAEGVTLSAINTGRFFEKSNKDRYIAHLDTLQLNNFDFLSYHKYRIFSASSLIFNRGTFALFSNPNGPQTQKDKIGTFPNFVLSNMKIDLKIDTILVRHINVTYTETNRKSKQTGTITFNNTSGRFLNVTNNKTALQKNNSCTVQLNSYFMNRGKLNLFLDFNLTDKLAAYRYKGTLGEMDLKAVNEATMPLAMVKINSGTLKKLDFNFKANSKIANGKVTVLYNDLKVTILKADTDNENLKRMRIASLFANIFIIKHNNPDQDGEVPRSFNVAYLRPINSPFFKFTWKSLLTGIKPCVGFDKKTQEVTAAMVSKSAINKQNRKIKREQRKLRRAERREKRAAKSMLKNSQKDQGMTNP
ncbi:MAG: hypothetical protein JWR67_2317 [Mucilaginibacter sp.]|nr:hypothetical protein [Mucilaginibacter sp.]